MHILKQTIKELVIEFENKNGVSILFEENEGDFNLTFLGNIKNFI